MQRNGRRLAMQGWRLVAALAAMGVCQANTASARDFIANESVENINNSRAWQLAMPKKGPHAVWISRDDITGYSSVMFNSRIYGEWGQLATVSDSGTDVKLPCIAVTDDETIFVAWVEQLTNSTSIQNAYSTNAGQTWSSSTWVGGVIQPQSTALIARGAKIFLAFTDNRNGNYDLFFRMSGNNGVTWTAPVLVNDDGLAHAHQATPDFAVDPVYGTLYLVWEDRRNSSPTESDIYFASSSDNGATWSTNVQVNDSSSGAKSQPAIVAATDGTLHVVWKDSRPGSPTEKIFYASSSDGGDTWGYNVQVDDGASASNQRPKIAVDDGDRVVVAWIRLNSSIAVAFKGDGVSNQEWSDPTYIANDASGSISGSLGGLGVIGSPVLVVWGDDDRDPDCSACSNVYSAFEEEE